MRTRFKARELTSMLLPIALLGGVGWWISKGGSLLPLRGMPADLYTGKPRVEFEPFTPVHLSSWDVAQGYTWGATTTIWQKGASPLNPSARRAAYEINSMRANVAYKRNGLWKEVPGAVSEFATDRDQQEFGNFNVKRRVNFKVKLKGVPPDAQEVRLRGHCYYTNSYQGAACKGVAPGPGWTIYPKVCIFKVQSRAFDWPLKTRSGPWPRPVVSRTPNLQLVGAHWMYAPSLYTVALHLRDPAGVLAANNRGDIALQNFSLRDGNGKEIILYEPGSKTAPRRRYSASFLGFIDRGALNPKLPKSDYIADLALRGEPLHGWESVKGPLRLRAQISDGTSWPTSVDVKMSLEQGYFRDIGGPQGTKP